MGKTCASLAVSDNGKEEEEEGARGADDCVILVDGKGRSPGLLMLPDVIIPAFF